ncbi:MAG: PspC domain-containing protein [Patescibacteria group bacterium]|nr:PspC domain-containing protein [Patescibacteria group bacterium]
MQQTKKIYRSQDDRIIFGVCGGIAKYFEVDALIVRLIFLALVFGGGSGLIIYLICTLLIPTEGKKNNNNFINEEKAEEFVEKIGEKIKDLGSETKRSDWRFLLGIIFVLFGFIFLVDNIFDLRNIWANFWPIFLVLIGLMILFKRK